MKPFVQVEQSGVDRTEIRYTWDDGADPDSFFQELDLVFVARLRPLQTRAVLAVSLGLLEWIIFRFRPFIVDEFPSQFTEASWAAMCNFRYLRPDLVDVDQWEGPIRGVLRETLLMVYQVLEATVSALEPELDCACIYKLAMHTVPESDQVKDWLDLVIPRLNQLYPRTEEDPVGPPVPRQFINPDDDPNSEEADYLLANFLAALDPGADPCLRRSDELLRIGFEGTPYRWDPSQDQDRYL